MPPEAADLSVIHRDIGEVKVSIAHLTERIDRLLEDRRLDEQARTEIRASIVALAERVDTLETAQAKQEGAYTVLRWLVAGGFFGGSALGAGATMLTQMGV